MTEQKLKELLADMTLEEKVNQMSQVVGAFFNKDMDITAMGPMADKGFTPENVALSGSMLPRMEPVSDTHLGEISHVRC